jgi:predicted RNA-binding protein associated with RNAse of E/G family
MPRMSRAEASREMVTIRYRRLPDRETVFTQALVAEEGDCTVTFLPAAEVKRETVVDGRTVLEPGSPVVWFTYRDRWHDVGRFHRADGTFTGFYANALTPVVFHGRTWETTDLCLDVWVGVDGRVEILDRDEFDAALAAGWIDARTAARALAEAESLAQAARAGTWPPPEVRAWTLPRARAAVEAAP